MSTKIDQHNCIHEFEFIHCRGSFCKHCDIPFGVKCLHPECKMHDCETHNLIFDDCIEGKFKKVVKKMTKDIYFLCLGHDGIISGKDDDVHKVLSFPGLKRVEFCGYYTDDNVLNIFKDKKYKHIEFIKIF